ncbi:hypothetical protein [Leucobacter komagatae]|uniref:hypothetical protein n=1 Tax=Leucobacter komagatae TaxID=55969 RepID=UPI0012ED94E6|nr:hypothetical protein [Leucobacter komagatae]
MTDAVLAVPGVSRIYAVSAPAAILAVVAAVLPGASESTVRPEVVLSDDDATATVSIGVDRGHSASTVARTVGIILEQKLHEVRPNSTTRISVTVAQIG